MSVAHFKHIFTRQTCWAQGARAGFANRVSKRAHVPGILNATKLSYCISTSNYKILRFLAATNSDFTCPL